MISMRRDQSETPNKQPQMVEELDVHPGLLFTTGGTMDSEEPSLVRGHVVSV